MLARALLPHHAARWMRRRRDRRRVPTVHGNAQLRLYHKMLPGDFLHYGYFDDPNTPPETISLAGLHDAQRRYAEEVAALIDRPDAPILDAGCGMGGMLAILGAGGRNVVGLTPDRFQIEHARRAHPGVPMLECRFEDMPARDHRGRFGTVVHAESVQYMDPGEVFRVVREILAPDGSWIVADYFREDSAEFRAGNAPERSGWMLDDFRRRLADSGFKIAAERDITANVLPTLAFAHLLATRIALPALDFAREKVRGKAPALHYVAEPAIDEALAKAARSAAVIDPAAFAAAKRYMLIKAARR